MYDSVIIKPPRLLVRYERRFPTGRTELWGDPAIATARLTYTLRPGARIYAISYSYYDVVYGQTVARIDDRGITMLNYLQIPMYYPWIKIQTCEKRQALVIEPIPPRKAPLTEQELHNDPALGDFYLLDPLAGKTTRVTCWVGDDTIWRENK